MLLRRHGEASRARLTGVELLVVVERFALLGVAGVPHEALAGVWGYFGEEHGVIGGSAGVRSSIGSNKKYQQQ